MKRIQLFLGLAILALASTLPARAQPGLGLHHDSSWHLAGRELTIELAELSNAGAEETEPLFASIYARGGSAYHDVGPLGVLIGRVPIGTVAGNSSLRDIRVTGRGRSIPPGTKFTMLAIERKNGRKFEMLTYVIYTSTYTFPRGQKGGVGSDDSPIGGADVVFLGETTLQVKGRRAEFAVERIRSFRFPIAETGLLRLAVYATREPFHEAPTRTLLAARPLGSLAPGDFYHQLSGKLALKRPGRGTFYLTLAVEEDAGSGYELRDIVSYPDTYQF